MNYFELDHAFETPEGVHIPSLNGETVKGYETFFHAGKCTFYTFYDREYEFDYLTPEEQGEIQDEPRVIADYHMWIGEQPMGGGSVLFLRSLRKFWKSTSYLTTASIKQKCFFKENFIPILCGDFLWKNTRNTSILIKPYTIIQTHGEIRLMMN